MFSIFKREHILRVCITVEETFIIRTILTLAVDSLGPKDPDSILDVAKDPSSAYGVRARKIRYSKRPRKWSVVSSLPILVVSSLFISGWLVLGVKADCLTTNLGL